MDKERSGSDIRNLFHEEHGFEGDPQKIEEALRGHGINQIEQLLEVQISDLLGINIKYQDACILLKLAR